MASKKKTTSTETRALKGSKAKEFPRIAEALSRPLGETAAPANATPAAEPAKAAADVDTKAKDKGKTKAKETKAKETKTKKVGALDAAARVLEEAGQPLNCVEMIETMAKKGYWTSPNGQTPHATLYAAILREMKVKGAAARFTKTERGKFARLQGK